MRLVTLQTFNQSDKKTRRQEDKRTKIRKGMKIKKIVRYCDVRAVLHCCSVLVGQLVTSGEDDMVETRRAVNDKKRVTNIPILPGTI